MSIFSIPSCSIKSSLLHYGFLRLEINGIKSLHYSGVQTSKEAVIARLNKLAQERKNEELNSIKSPFNLCLFS